MSPMKSINMYWEEQVWDKNTQDFKWKSENLVLFFFNYHENLIY